MEFVEVELNKNAYYIKYNPGEYEKNANVIVSINGILYFGTITSNKITKIDNEKIVEYVRLADKTDEIKYSKNLKIAEQALVKCREIAEKENLKMNVVDAIFSFDRKKMLINFLSDNRIDFRNLVKELATIYHARIELRQIGARDKAKEIGGLGICGRKLCCARFLNDLNTVSIGMAKNQNISLNPSKINGCCGRLLCCLKYENETYTELRNNLPNVGDKVNVGGCAGCVVNINILKQKYKVELENKGLIEVGKD
jgi:cell fate regulator YaaT (PSP1 superfamily)